MKIKPRTVETSASYDQNHSFTTKISTLNKRDKENPFQTQEFGSWRLKRGKEEENRPQ